MSLCCLDDENAGTMLSSASLEVLASWFDIGDHHAFPWLDMAHLGLLFLLLQVTFRGTLSQSSHKALHPRAQAFALKVSSFQHLRILACLHQIQDISISPAATIN